MSGAAFINVYEAVGPADTTEGRFPGTISYGYFASERAATQQAQGKGVMGTPGEVKKHQAIMSGGKIYLAREIQLHQSVEDFRRQQALDKLTDEDKKILGLK